MEPLNSLWTAYKFHRKQPRIPRKMETVEERQPSTVITDTWCSSGALLPSGTLIQSGDFHGGNKVVRYFRPCEDCDWDEDPDGLVSPRWYASNQILLKGNVIVVRGRN
ncbi:Glyoxal oxidase, N-terminal [Dillenia turbinata]|uniref:Glyoxal oxidase, N-terminal n=1 Tax=Dillenia turbinata TaxID=194707 RepID=A0AAN8VWU8_9MAGN